MDCPVCEGLGVCDNHNPVFMRLITLLNTFPGERLRALYAFLASGVTPDKTAFSGNHSSLPDIPYAGLPPFLQDFGDSGFKKKQRKLPVGARSGRGPFRNPFSHARPGFAAHFCDKCEGLFPDMVRLILHQRRHHNLTYAELWSPRFSKKSLGLDENNVFAWDCQHCECAGETVDLYIDHFVEQHPEMLFEAFQTFPEFYDE